MNFLSKEHRGEDGDVVQTVLIIAVFTIVVMMVGSLLYQAIAGKYQDTRTTLVSNLGQSLEEWIVANPDQNIPFTDDYTRYISYDFVEEQDLIPVERMDERMAMGTYIKVVPGSSPASFKICSYGSEEQKSEKPKAISVFDSTTGQVTPSTLEECSR